MKKNTQNNTHRYKIEDSILYNEQDEYSLSEYEFCALYAFYVTYSMCGRQSIKKRTFKDYGWENNSIIGIVDHKRVATPLGNALKSVIEINNDNYCFLTNEGNIKELYIKNNLQDGKLTDYDTERVVIGETKTENNKYLKLFYRIRDGFAHGKFVLKYSSNNEKMVIIQDDNSKNVTARIVLKLSTLLNIVEVVDINGLIVHRVGKIKSVA